MNRRLIRSLAYLLVAGQVLLLAPLASAMPDATSAVATEMPCAESMPQTDDQKPCPCCPEGTADMAACLSACMASVAALPAFNVQFVRTPPHRAPSIAFLPVSDRADPPLNPPPIV